VKPDPTLPDSADADAAFLALVSSHHAIIAKVVRHYAYEDADRDDLRQEILGQLWRAFPSFSGRARLSTWVYRVALNVAISQHRHRRRHDVRLVQPETGELERVADDAPESDDRLTLVEAFLASLGEFDRALLMLYLDDHSHQEIGESLGITPTNASTRISRLKARFKNETTTSALEGKNGSR
jgi:RNA polymerase sigma-70 factor, ECF subfamily